MVRMRAVLLLAVSLAFYLPAYAQKNTTGSITASSSNCSVAGSCVSVNKSADDAGSAIRLSGTFSATLEFEGRVGSTWSSVTGVPLTAGAAATSPTATGGWLFSLPGVTGLRVRASAYTSGTVTVDIQSSARAPVLLTDTTPVSTAETTCTLDRYISVGVTEDEHEVKASAGTLCGISARNAHATTAAYIKCTNLTAANTTPGSSAIIYEMQVPAASWFVDGQINAAFSVALTCYIVTGKANNDATEVAANDVTYNLRYR